MVVPFFSVPVGTEEKLVFGKAHYSWRIAADHFIAMFEQESIAPRLVVSPHMYDSEVSMSYLMKGRAGVPVHMIFRPFSDVRLLKPAYNIGVIVWEFDSLNGCDGLNDLPDTHPFHNQIRMLKILDEVWTASSYAKNVYERYGVKNVKLIPAPIKLRYTGRRARKNLNLLSFVNSSTVDMSHQRSPHSNYLLNARNTKALSQQEILKDRGSRKVYISILNPGDERKNISVLLKAFAGFHKKNPDAILIVKCSIDNIATTLEVVQRDTIRHKLQDTVSVSSPGIILISASLNQDELNEFFDIADFYVCTSRCEGQNLPLLEAMASGVVPISVSNTAMSDYIEEENSFLINSEKSPVSNGNATAHFGEKMHWFEASERDVLAALVASYDSSEEILEKKRSACAKMITEKYSPKAVFAKVEDSFLNIEKNVKC